MTDYQDGYADGSILAPIWPPAPVQAYVDGYTQGAIDNFTPPSDWTTAMIHAGAATIAIKPAPTPARNSP